MNKLFEILKKEWFGAIGLCCLFLYEFLFSSLINIQPFNHIANLILILFFSSSIVTCFFKNQWIKVENRQFFIIIFLLLLFFSLSDICNNSISLKPFVLLIVLFSSYVLYQSTDFPLYIIMFVVLLAVTFGLSLIVIKNIRTILAVKSIYSAPFLNLDSFAAIARNGFSFGLLLIFGFKENKNTIPFKIVAILFTCICFSYLIFSFRVGSLILTLLFLLVCLTYVLFINNKINAILIMYSLLIVAFACFLFIPSKLEIINRVQRAFIQLFNLDYIYEGSTRERVLMIFRDLSLSLRFPFYGAGSNYSENINYMYGHNAFGSIAFSYGWSSLIIYVMLCFIPSLYFIKKKEKKQIVFFAIYFLTIQIFDLLYGMGSVSRQNYIVIGLTFALYVKDKQNAKNQPHLFYEVSL